MRDFQPSRVGETMGIAEYAFLTGRTRDAIIDDLTRGALESTRLPGGDLVVAAAAADAVRITRESRDV
jgi:hypothetical protein